MPLRALWLMLLWTLFVLYPNPSYLFVSIVQAWNPVIDPEAVRDLAATLPDDPRLIEAAVNSTLVPYAVPWQSYGVPWYFPTPTEVLARGQSDCQGRAVVLASLLRAKGIDATLVGSFDHIWVEYPGKHATAQENAAIAIVEQQPSGEYQFQWPELIKWRESWEIERSYFWDAMPSGRWWLMLLGWTTIGGWHSRSLRRLLVMLWTNNRQPAAA